MLYPNQAPQYGMIGRGIADKTSLHQLFHAFVIGCIGLDFRRMHNFSPGDGEGIVITLMTSCTNQCRIETDMRSVTPVFVVEVIQKTCE